MKYLLLALCCLCISALPASAKEKEFLSGIYQTTFESGMMPTEDTGETCEAPYKLIGTICADPYTATNTLGLFQEENGDLDFAAELSFFNGHSCTVSGVAKKNANGWLFESVEAEEKCKLTISRKDETVTFNTQEGFDCQYYCGARGSLDDAAFPLSSRTEQTVSGKDDLTCISSMEEPCNNKKAEK